ncbi:hypothetical protein [Niameybacter massiliensis]|uniref:hypothetical protein n=1 Tax=Niameybacter massiliensis TaxID=1658108 RepID=UPI0006B560A7|nr:hypothetical protein [Niameybacter massiliensis]
MKIDKYMPITNDRTLSTSSSNKKSVIHEQKSFQHSINKVYAHHTTYTKQGLVETTTNKKVLAITADYLEQLLANDTLNIQTDGDKYWVIIDDLLYEFSIIPKDSHKEDSKSNTQVLLNTVQECLERNQEQLDRKFKDWTLKKDILYPNQGKNALITLDDLIEKKLEYLSYSKALKIYEDDHENL